MGLAKRTAHATTATISALAEAQEEKSSPAGVPASYFDHRADQLDQAVRELADEQGDADAAFKKDKAALEMEHELEREDLLRQLEQERIAKLAELEREQEAEAAKLEQEHETASAERGEEKRQLSKQAADFRHQARRYRKNPLRCSYLDCLKGTASVPKEPAGMILFQAMMVGGMVLAMTTFNGVRHSGLDFFIDYHWMYPLYFCMTFMIRQLFMNRFTDAIIGRAVLPHLSGFPKVLAIAFVNICLMVPLMATVMTCMLYGFDDLPATLSTQVPLNVAVSICVNVFVVGPIVKMLYNNVIVANSQGGTGFYTRFQQLVMPMLSAFNS